MIRFETEELSSDSMRVWLCRTQDSYFDITVESIGEPKKILIIFDMIRFETEELSSDSMRVWLCRTQDSYFDITVESIGKSKTTLVISNVREFDDTQIKTICNGLIDAHKTNKYVWSVDWNKLIKYVLVN